MLQDVLLLCQLLLAFSPILIALSVLQDARRQTSAGRRVGVYVGNVGLDKPETWAMACLVMWILALPLYLRARSES